MDRRSLGLKCTERLGESFEALYKNYFSPFWKFRNIFFYKNCNLNVMISCLRQTQTMVTKRLFTPRQKNDFLFPPCCKRCCFWTDNFLWNVVSLTRQKDFWIVQKRFVHMFHHILVYCKATKKIAWTNILACYEVKTTFKAKLDYQEAAESKRIL